MSRLSRPPFNTTSTLHPQDLIYYFTAGETEVRCWTILKGTLAPQVGVWVGVWVGVGVDLEGDEWEIAQAAEIAGRERGFRAI